MPVIDQRTEIAIKSIVLSTDFTPASEKAVAYARAIARRFGSSIELTHILDLSVAIPSDSSMIGISIDQMHRESTRNLNRLAHEFPGTNLHILEQEAFSLPSAILSVARNTEADLIVMGTASKHGLRKMILGSTAESVLRRATCPVLTVGPHVPPPPQDPLAFRNIVYATDFSTQAAHAAIYALSFAQDSGAHLYLCHVLGTHEPKGEKLVLQSSFERSLKEIVPPSAYDWCSPECVIEHGDTAEAILGLAERVNADLIVLGARKASFWLDYFETGVNPAVLAEARCPVLTICA